MKQRLLYWIPTILLVAGMVASAVYYFVDTPAVALVYKELGYPAYTIYFNAIAKILGGIAIMFPVSQIFKEWSYAGYLYILCLALQAILMKMPTESALPMIGFFALWAFSYWRYRIKNFDVNCL